MFKKILIANRGEVALRVIRACKELEIPTVAVYSEADSDSLHTKFADEAVCIGDSPPLRSYLNIPNIISAAEITGADAIHPGYGFLAENLQFAEVCESCDIVFVGPPVDAMEKAGDKSRAKQVVKETGIPVIPGTEGTVKKTKDALDFAKEASYPVVVKASAGGGGRGMRIVQNEQELKQLLHTASAEAEAAFGNSDVYLEKYLEEPRHIEFQILADSYGKVIHLGERDCSIQRRHQKLIEECPSTFLEDEDRQRMGKAAIAVAMAVGYVNAGTIEFLVDKNKNYYFMEMNTRIQVEHPITEEVTGLDLVKEQIRIASGKKLTHSQSDVELKGHALEFRINAEDPEKDFLPQSGRVDSYNPPGGPGIRVDTHIYSGYVIPLYYDSLLAKLIVWGEDRNEAIARAKRGLGEFIIGGLKTTIPFDLNVIDNAFFRKGEVYTNFVSRRILNE